MMSTPQKKEESAHEKNNRMSADVLPETVYEADSQGRMTFVNRKAFEYFGYTREDVDGGLSIGDMVIPGDRGRVSEHVLALLNDEHTSVDDYTMQRKDGSTFPALISSAAVIQEGKPVGVRGIIIDITGRKQAEEMVQNSFTRFQLSLSNLYAGICVLFQVF
jgi:PAS domain S-box-containing protein